MTQPKPTPGSAPYPSGSHPNAVKRGSPALGNSKEDISFEEAEEEADESFKHKYESQYAKKSVEDFSGATSDEPDFSLPQLPDIDQASLNVPGVMSKTPTPTTTVFPNGISAEEPAEYSAFDPKSVIQDALARGPADVNEVQSNEFERRGQEEAKADKYGDGGHVSYEGGYQDDVTSTPVQTHSELYQPEFSPESKRQAAAGGASFSPQSIPPAGSPLPEGPVKSREGSEARDSGLTRDNGSLSRDGLTRDDSLSRDNTSLSRDNSTSSHNPSSSPSYPFQHYEQRDHSATVESPKFYSSRSPDISRQPTLPIVVPEQQEPEVVVEKKQAVVGTVSAERVGGGGGGGGSGRGISGLAIGHTPPNSLAYHENLGTYSTSSNTTIE